MAEQILSCGNYEVWLDAGFVVNEFTLDVSELDGTDVLDGNIDYFDVTEYVAAVRISRGRQNVRDSLEAGQATISIYDLNGDFTVVNDNSPYWNVARDRLGFEPTKRVRILRDGELLFVGQITEYQQEITLANESYVTVRASDDLLRIQNARIAAHTATEELSGARLNAILDRSEVNLFVGAGLRNISDGVAPLGAYPVEPDLSVRDYFNRIQTAEQGRIFMARDGVFTAQDRIGRAPLNMPLMLSDQGDGGLAYTSLSLRYQ